MSDTLLKKSKSGSYFRNEVETNWGELREAYFLLWDSKLDEAEALVVDKKENNIWYMFVYTEIGLWRWNFGEKKEDEEELELRMAMAEKMSEYLQDKNKPESSKTPQEGRVLRYLDGLITNAFTYLCYAMVRLRQGSIMKGGYDIRKSWVFFRDAEAYLEKIHGYGYNADPKVVGLLHFGLGTFHFFVSIMPPHLMWIIKLLGFEPNKELALQELAQCRESECIKSIEASLVLYGIRRYFTEEEENADALIIGMKEEHPHSAVIHYLNGLVRRMKGDISEAIEDLVEAEDKMHMEQMRVTLKYHLGTSYMLKSEFETAKEKFNLFLQNNTGKYFRTWSAYQIGLCNIFLDKDKDEIEQHFKNAIKWKKDKDAYDEYASRKCKEYLKKGGFMDYEVILFKAQLLHEAKRFEDCLKVLEKFEANPKDKGYRDFCALNFYYTGSCYKNLNDHENAKVFLNKAIELDKYIKKEKYAVPHSYLDLAEIAISEKDYPLANELLKKAKDYSDYDWQAFANIYILAATQKVKRLDNTERK